MTEDRDDTTPEIPEPAPEEAAGETGPAPGPPVASGEAAAPVGDGAGGDDALPLVEALLFAASKPVALDKLAEAAELSEDVVVEAVSRLEAACAAPGRGVRLDRVAGGIRLVTRPEYDYPVRRLLGLDGKTKLSMAALETLSIVAYRQPVTGPEIAELRSVNSSSSIRTLLDRKLITTAGRKEVVGTPFLYKTTKEFLVHFGLKDLGDLPKPEELEAIYGLEAPKTDPAQTELFHVDEATGEVEEAVELEAEPASPAGDDPPGAEAGSPAGPGAAGPDATGPADAPSMVAAEVPADPSASSDERNSGVAGAPASEEDPHDV